LVGRFFLSIYGTLSVSTLISELIDTVLPFLPRNHFFLGLGLCTAFPEQVFCCSELLDPGTQTLMTYK
jgi:hypothetical protein